MKYTYLFTTYNYVDVEADNEAEAFEKAQAAYYDICDPLWDEAEIIPREKALEMARKYGHSYE